MSLSLRLLVQPAIVDPVRTLGALRGPGTSFLKHSKGESFMVLDFLVDGLWAYQSHKTIVSCCLDGTYYFSFRERNSKLGEQVFLDLNQWTKGCKFSTETMFYPFGFLSWQTGSISQNKIYHEWDLALVDSEDKGHLVPSGWHCQCLQMIGDLIVSEINFWDLL